MTTPCLKNCAKLFLSELRQISTKFDNFWQKDDKEAKIMPNSLHHTTVLNANVPNCYTTL